MEFSSSPKLHPVGTKSKKSPSVASPRSRTETPISASFVRQTSIIGCKSSEVRTPLVFHGDAMTHRSDKANENVGAESSAFVFGASSRTSGTGTDIGTGTGRFVFNNYSTPRANKQNENGGEETSPFVYEASPHKSGTDNGTSTGAGTENDGFVFSTRSKDSDFSANSGPSLWKGLLPKITKEVRELKMDEKTMNHSVSKDLPLNDEIKEDNIQNQIKENERFIFGTGGKTVENEKIKLSKNGDKRIQKKGEIKRIPTGKKFGGSSMESKPSMKNFTETGLNEEGFEPMDYLPYEEVLINANNNNYNNIEAGNNYNITELKYGENLPKNSLDLEKKEKHLNLKSEDLRPEMSNLDSKIDTQINAGGTLFNSSGEISGNNFCFCTSKNSNSDQITAKKHKRKKNKSRLGQSGNNAYINQPNSSDLGFSPLISDNINFEININKSPINSNKETIIASGVGTEEGCEKWRARGNQAYENGDIKTAEEYYTLGINSLSPNSKNRALMLCYSNRAACRISLGRMREALNDCLIASNIDSEFLKVKLRAANCLLALGDFEEAIKYYNKCLDSNSEPKIFSEASHGLAKAQKVSELVIQAEEIIQKQKSDEISKALEIISDAFSISSLSDKLMKLKAEALLSLGKYDEAIKFCEKNKNATEKDFDAQIWRLNIISKSYFYLGKLDEALEALRKKEQAAVASRRGESKYSESDSSFFVTVQELIRLKAMGNEAFQAGKYNEAMDYYTAAINVSADSKHFTAILLCNRAASYQALSQIIDAIADCSLAISLDSNYAKAISRRATLYELIRDYTQAAKDLRALISLLENNKIIQENQNLKINNIADDLNRARQRLLSTEEEAKKGIPLNMYLILGVETSTSVAEVKKAYRKAALRHHPDKAGQFLTRNENINDAFHKDADHLFKIIGEAYNVLSDSTKRVKYDNDEQKRASKKKGISTR